jgi:electron transfer flavoprotein beta subunit
LRIIVCIKQVLDTEFELSIDEDTGAIKHNVQQEAYVVNPTDRCAVEAALQVKKQLSHVTLTTVTVGPDRAEKALQYCLAQGVDEAIHIVYDDFNSLDPYATALVLSKAISRLNCGLILCGDRSLDSAACQVGVNLAELLDLPQATHVVQLQVAPDLREAIVQRRLDKGKRETLICPLPAVLIVNRLINEPRYVSVHNRLLVTKQNVVKADLASLGLDSISLRENCSLTLMTHISLPRPRVKTVTRFDTSLSAEDRQRMLMQGGLAEMKRTEFLEGTPEDIAVKVEEYLKKEGIIPVKS